MFQKDYLLRLIEKLAEAVAAWRRTGAGGHPVEVDEILKEAAGLSIHTIDALSVDALVRLLSRDDPLAHRRCRVVADALSALAEIEGGPWAASRKAKAEALGERASGS